jgi:hypothetical protein
MHMECADMQIHTDALIIITCRHDTCYAQFNTNQTWHHYQDPDKSRIPIWKITLAT